MEKQFGGQNQPAPEELMEIEKSRTISDGKLLEQGAEYFLNEDGEKLMNVTEKQEKEINEEHEEEERILKEYKESGNKVAQSVYEFLKLARVKKSDLVTITRVGGSKRDYFFDELRRDLLDYKTVDINSGNWDNSQYLSGTTILDERIKTIEANGKKLEFPDMLA